MKGVLKYSISILSILLIILSCQKQVDYSKDILDIRTQISNINSRLDSITNAIKLVTSQLTNIESSLKSKIDNVNIRIDSISLSVGTDPEPESNPHINSSREIQFIGTSNNIAVQQPTITQKQIQNKK